MLCSRSFALPAALLLGTLQHVLAQTSSACNPTTNSSCPTDPALSTSHTWTFNTTSAPSTDIWTVTAGTIDWTETAAEFTIKQQGDSPTIRSEFYIFGGRVEAHMRAAPGQGIISSLMLLSDDLDEIDWEFLGGDSTEVQTNYFGKGTNNYTWEKDFYPTGGVQDVYHNYTLDWTNETLKWYLDGELKRTLTPEEANNTHSYPQTPMRVFVGPWAGGDPDNAKGTIEWAGGETDYTKGPFTMYVSSISVTDYGRGTAYEYTDTSGTWDSINMLETEKNSTAADTIATDANTDTRTLSEKFNDLSTGAKAGVGVGSAAAVVGLLAFAGLTCYKQRKRGAAEAALAAQKSDDERLELEGYKARGVNPDGFSEVQPEYDAATGMGTVTRTVEAEKFGAVAMGGAAGAAAMASRPLLNDHQGGSAPGTPYDDVHHDPYSDGFSPIDGGRGGFSNLNGQYGPSSPPSGPLPGPPNQNFSNSGQQGGWGGNGHY